MQKSFPSREAWRQWLTENHAQCEELWLVYYKKASGKPSVGYRESVKEAICFGWIDGLKRSLDEERYMHRFTPRRPKSKWSPLNVRYAEEMIAADLMTPAGLAVFEQRLEYDQAFLETRAEKDPDLPVEMAEAIKAHPRAWQFFNDLAPSYRKQYVAWMTAAKREDTRQRRLKEAIDRLSAGKKLGMK